MRVKFRGLAVLAAFIGCLFVGTMGYYLIEGWPLLDSLYMTVITITTVGFHEENPLSPTGKVFTIFLIFVGFGICLYTISNFTQLVLHGEFKLWLRRNFMSARIDLGKDHYILCGYGRMGRVIAKNLAHKKIPFVVIETDESAANGFKDETFPVVFGNSGDEATLEEAGIQNAKCLISVVSSDAENAFTVMTARRLRNDLHIVSRCFKPSNTTKIRHAGANQVISPYELSGQRLTQAAIHPTMVEFVEFIEDIEETSIEMADLIVKPTSKFVGKPLSDPIFHKWDVMVIGIKKDHGEFTFHPRGGAVVEANDHLVIVGHRDQVSGVADFCDA